MNAARMKKCMQGGKSRAACQKEVYPDGSGKKGDGKKMPFTKKNGGGKKPPPRY